MNENNPFVVPAKATGDGPTGPGEFVPDGRQVPAGNGVAWISAGWELFRKAPGVWIGIAVVFMIIVVGLAGIPLAGLLINLLVPVFVGGLMLGCKTLDEGGELRFSHLFAGFSGHAGNLVLVGVLFLIGSAIAAVAIAAAMMVAGFSIGTTMMGGHVLNPGAVLLPMLIGLALFLPVTMAIWFAPALVVLHGMAPLPALKASFIACLKNLIPFLLYGLALLVLAIIASIPFGLGWLVLAPVTYGSLYAGYRDIFIRA